jgi:hypothetical protein
MTVLAIARRNERWTVRPTDGTPCTATTITQRDTDSIIHKATLRYLLTYGFSPTSPPSGVSFSLCMSL